MQTRIEKYRITDISQECGCPECGCLSFVDDFAFEVLDVECAIESGYCSRTCASLGAMAIIEQEEILRA